jgi:excisionase family DNA binding protein
MSAKLEVCVEERHYSLSEVARILGKSERTIRRWIKLGTLRAYKPGRDFLIPESALRELMEESEVPKVAPTLPFPSEVEEERGLVVSEAFDAYVRNRAAAHEREVRDPASPHFRDATAAALWIAMLDEERDALISFMLGKAQPLMKGRSPEERGPLLMQLLWPVGRLANVALQAEERLDGMSDQPDQLAARKREKTRAATKESERRLAELQDTGS